MVSKDKMHVAWNASFFLFVLEVARACLYNCANSDGPNRIIQVGILYYPITWRTGYRVQLHIMKGGNYHQSTTEGDHVI